MNLHTPLSPDSVFRRCDPHLLPFKTTADLASLDQIIGQDRAIEAIQAGIGIRHDGFNLFALGPNGTGKFTAVSQYLQQTAAAAPAPDDWCYVYNFDQPHRPQALRLAAGMAATLQASMKGLVEDLQTMLPAAFKSDEYQAQQKAIEEEFKEKQSAALEQIKEQALKHQIALVRTPSGFAFAPLKQGEVLKPEEFMSLSPAEQGDIEREIGRLQDALQEIMEQIPHWQRDSQNRLKQLSQEIARHTITPLFAERQQAFAAFPDVLAYLDAVKRDIVENFSQFLDGEEQSLAAAIGLTDGAPGKERTLTRYQINVMVDHSTTSGAPVIHEDKPTYLNLVGRIEHVSQMGTLLTDFTLIKPGSLHRASGGYLMVDARRLLMEPYAWEALKQALRSKQVRIESLGQAYSLISTVSLEPEPIPLAVKVVLLGERQLYYLLSQYDPDFGELFKVAADFEDDMQRSDANHLAYAQLIAGLVRQEALLHFDKTAVARVIEHAARLAGDADKLTTHMQSISDLLREADYWARQAGAELIGVAHVDQALAAQIRRASRIRERIQESMLHETLLIDTDGSRVGQINGLAVYGLEHPHSFGRPSRITARVRMGKGEVVDIERQVEMGGPIHSKGVMILAGFLGARYAADWPLSLSATLVFEQSYSGVDGDSASSAELYALLSALADLPIAQGLAVTGSVNQYGQVQAIGGVNEKIEGFFDLCQARGLTGRQGVLIPAANVRHLMLRADVVEAITRGQFSVYPVSSVDQGMTLLTGTPAGDLDEAGAYPADSVNGRVVSRLHAFAEQQRSFAAPPAAKNAAQAEGAGHGN